MPVLYERAIECAASEQKTNHSWCAALHGFWEGYLGFQVGEVRWLWNFELKSLIDKEVPPNLISLVQRALCKERLKAYLVAVTRGPHIVSVGSARRGGD